MILTSPFRTVGRVAAVVGILTGLLLGGASTATAEEVEKPRSVGGFANAPGWITVTWAYDGDRYDVAKFVIKRRNPNGSTVDAGWADAGRSDFTDKFLEPNTTYRYFVCAIGHDLSFACADELSPPITTLPLPPPPPSGGSSGGSGAPAGVKLPPEVAMPQLRAKVVSPAQIDLAWDLPPSGSVVLTHGRLYRDGTVIRLPNGDPYEALQPGNYDGDYTDVNRRQGTTYRYTFCFEGPAFGERCSSEVTVRTPLVIAEPYTPGAGTQVSPVISAPASPGAKPYTPGASTTVRGVPTPVPVAGPYRPGVGTTRSMP